MGLGHHQFGRSLEERMDLVEDRLAVVEIRPLVSTKQVMIACSAVLTSVFAAGAWAQNVQGKITQMLSTQTTMSSKIEQITQIDRLQDRIERMEKELDRLREAAARR